ncbi:MAG: hypothetical protein QXJ49_07185 [Nitrososphaerota archaeon]
MGTGLDGNRVLIVALLVAASVLGTTSVFGEGPVPGTNFATAAELQPGVYSFHLQPGDLHFFKVTLRQGQTLYVTVRMAADVDFDVAVLSPERDLLESGVKPAGYYERVSVKASRAGSYYVVVYPFGASSGSYTLEVSVADEPSVTATVTVTEYRYVTVAVPAITVTREAVVVRTVAQQVAEDRGPLFNLLGMLAIAVGLVVASVVVGASFSGLRAGAPKPAEEKSSQQGGG